MYNFLCDCVKKSSNNLFSDLSSILDKSEYVKYSFEAPKLVEIDNLTYYDNLVIEEIEVIYRKIRKKWFQLQNIVLNDVSLAYSDISLLRQSLNSLFQAIIRALKKCNDEEMLEDYKKIVNKQTMVFSTALIKFSKLENGTIMKLLYATEETNPIFQYLHTFYDTNLYLLMILYICDNPSDFEKRLKCLLEDLLVLHNKQHCRKQSRDLSLFNCDCMKNIWMICWCFSETIEDNKFWPLVNELLTNQEPSMCLAILKEISLFQPVNFINKYRKIEVQQNYHLVETKINQILSKSPTNSELLYCLQLAEPLVCKLWLKHSKIELYDMLWSFFNKRLNDSVGNQQNLPTNALQVVQKYETVLKDPCLCVDSFEIFVGMFLKHIKEYPSHWNKFKGRIFSQLGSNKVSNLNNAGIVRIMVLYVSLYSLYPDEMKKIIQKFVNSLPKDKRNTDLVWNLYIALLIKSVNNDQPIDQLTGTLLTWLEDASKDSKCFYLIKILIENLENLLSTTNTPLYEWHLVNNWLTTYLSRCYEHDLCTTFEIFARIYEKVERTGNWDDVYEKHVYKSLKLAVSSSGTAMMGRLAGKLSLASSSLMRDAFVYFNGDAININVCCEYLTVILDEYPARVCLSQQDERLCIQSWCRICLLTKVISDNGSCKRLTKNILKFDLFSNEMKQSLMREPDALVTLINYYNLNKHEITDCTVYEVIFERMDKFVQQYLVDPKWEMKKESIVYRIYTVVSLAFLDCGNLMYFRHRTTSPLTRLVTVLLLPTEFLRGQDFHPFILNSIKKTWSVFFKAIVNMNENNDDLYLDRRISDLVVKYVPLFPQLDSPIMKCMEDERLAAVILAKLTDGYFQRHKKESVKSVTKAIRFLNDFIKSSTSLELFRLIVGKTIKGLFVLFMFQTEQRNETISVINSIVNSPMYDNVNGLVRGAVVAITKEHLASDTNVYFDLLMNLVRFIPNDLRLCLCDIKQSVTNVERLRGLGFDERLRNPFERLEKTLKN